MLNLPNFNAQLTLFKSKFYYFSDMTEESNPELLYPKVGKCAIECGECDDNGIKTCVMADCNTREVKCKTERPPNPDVEPNPFPPIGKCYCNGYGGPQYPRPNKDECYDRHGSWCCTGGGLTTCMTV